jgi:hypothetical protein
LLLDHSSQCAIESLLVCSVAVTDWGEFSDCEHAECVDALGVFHAVPIATISSATCTAPIIAVRCVRTFDRSSWMLARRGMVIVVCFPTHTFPTLLNPFRHFFRTTLCSFAVPTFVPLSFRIAFTPYHPHHPILVLFLRCYVLFCCRHRLGCPVALGCGVAWYLG